MGYVAIGLIIGSTVLAGAHQGSGPAEPLRRLSYLVGTWDVQDEYQPADGPAIRESGVRVCTFIMQDTYIECRTTAQGASGRRREYRWFINYNGETRRYEFVALFSNVAIKDVKSFRTDETGRTWNIRNGTTSVDDGVERWHWATLAFDGDDRAVWTGYRNAETDPPQTWVRTSRETWVRRSR